MSSGKLWGSLSTVIALVLAVVALCAWGYVTLQHRTERQLLVYSVSTRLEACHITDVRQATGNIGDNSDEPVDAGDVTSDSKPASKEVKKVARDIMTWCFQRWGGPLGARVGNDSMGIKLGIWNDRFENVRCAVMLLALQQLNAGLKAKQQKATPGSNEPGTVHANKH